MERNEAVELLRELIDKNLASPSLMSLEKNQRGRFKVIMKDDCDTMAIREFVAEKNLMVEVDSERGYCVIRRP